MYAYFGGQRFNTWLVGVASSGSLGNKLQKMNKTFFASRFLRFVLWQTAYTVHAHWCIRSKFNTSCASFSVGKYANLNLSSYTAFGGVSRRAVGCFVFHAVLPFLGQELHVRAKALYMYPFTPESGGTCSLLPQSTWSPKQKVGCPVD